MTSIKKLIFISIVLCTGSVSSVYAGYIITTIAGGGTSGLGDGGSATSAELFNPFAVAVDVAGNIYIADEGNNRIRKVNTSGIISTFAGNGTPGFSGDLGSATTAQLSSPYGIAVDTSGNVYIADTGNNLIRKVNTSGIISTFAGGGVNNPGDGGSATSAELYWPTGVAFDSSGNVYIAAAGDQRIRKVNTSGIISTFAGNGTVGFSGDLGSATSAQLNWPKEVATDSSGDVYIADSGDKNSPDLSNNRIRKVNITGIISTFAGGGTLGLGDGGSATSAQLNIPYGVAVDTSGNVYIADSDNQRIRKVNALGIISTFAGGGTTFGDGGNATSAQLNSPSGVAVDSLGNVYIADGGNNRIRKVSFIQTGSISGQITNSSGTTAIPGAVVLALQSGGTTTAQAIANSVGNYSIQLATGSYSVTASSTGYNSQTQVVAVMSGQTVSLNFALTAVPTNNGPSLTWETGFPNGAMQSSGTIGGVINFAINYVDPNNLPPLAGYPKIHIQGAMSTLEIPGSPITMSLNTTQTPANYAGGVEYVYNYNNISAPPTPPGVYNYWFEAYNLNNAPAGGVDLKKTTLTIIGSNASGGLGSAHPYPSFARLSNGDKISFVGLTPNAELKIFTPAGNLVQTLQADSSGVVTPWDGTVDGGGRAGSGTYIIRVSDGKGDKKTLKVLIVR